MNRSFIALLCFSGLVGLLYSILHFDLFIFKPGFRAWLPQFDFSILLFSLIFTSFFIRFHFLMNLLILVLLSFTFWLMILSRAFTFSWNRPLRLPNDLSVWHNLIDLFTQTTELSFWYFYLLVGCFVIVTMVYFQLTMGAFNRISIGLRSTIGFTVILFGSTYYFYLNQEPIESKLKDLVANWNQVSDRDSLEELLLIDRRIKKMIAYDKSEVLKPIEPLDVIIFTIESYGEAAYARSKYRNDMLKVLDRLIDRLEPLGYQLQTSFLRSPVFGGGSWYADITFSCGIEVWEPHRYQLVARSAMSCIADYFNKAGYRTIEARPGVSGIWPYEKFFGYDQHYFLQDFHYQGPTYSWAPLPDQYVLQYIYEHELNKREHNQPLFMKFDLVSSHWPHDKIPELLPWDQVTQNNGGQYIDSKITQFQQGEGYIESIAYEMEIIGQYIEKYLRENSLIIIYGDHQPWKVLTGPDASNNVPIHIISSGHHFIKKFEQLGFVNESQEIQPLAYAKELSTFLETLVANFFEDPGSRGLLVEVKELLNTFQSGNSMNQKLVSQASCSLLSPEIESNMLNKWVQELHTGKKPMELVREMINSSEFAHHHHFDTLSSVEKVNLIYQKLLLRSADEAGIAHYTKVLEEQGFARVIDAILASHEYAIRVGEYAIPVSEKSCAI